MASELLTTELLRSTLHGHFASVAPATLPLAVVRLLRFDLGWSSFGTTVVVSGTLDTAIDGAALNGVELCDGGLNELAALFGGSAAAAPLPPPAEGASPPADEAAEAAAASAGAPAGGAAPAQRVISAEELAAHAEGGEHADVWVALYGKVR